jgi:hypothetical protein
VKIHGSKLLPDYVQVSAILEAKGAMAINNSLVTKLQGHSPESKKCQINRWFSLPFIIILKYQANMSLEIHIIWLKVQRNQVLPSVTRRIRDD